MKKTDITLIEIKAEVFEFNDIDNKLLTSEMEKNETRASNNPIHVAFEDRIINYVSGSEFEKLINKIIAIGNERNVVLNHCHLLVHEPLESTNTHHHINLYRPNVYSWVYYVSVPEGSGSLIFLHDQYDMGPIHEIKPVEGTLIMFPSYMLHKVTKNMSKQKRISISGDFSHN